MAVRMGREATDCTALLVRVLLALLSFALIAFASPSKAHDIPGEMRVHAFVKPEGDRLHVLARLPLSLLLNIDLPKKGPGYLDLAQIDGAIVRATAATDKAIALFEDGHRLSLAAGSGRISLPSDRSFENFETARSLLRGPSLPENTYVFWNQGYFDAYLEYSIKSPKSSFTLDFGIAPGLRDRVKVDLRFLSPGGVVRAYEFSSGSGSIALDPYWYQAAWSFVQSGFAHILDGPDHLLFLLCLIIPFRRIDWNLAGVITAFTLGHSVTLIAAAYNVVPFGAWFPPLIELLIASSILYMAIENVVKPDLTRRWLIAGIFGLVHGFGFSFMLQSQLQFAGSHLLVSLVAFNIGIELGQLFVLLIALPVFLLLYRHVGSERVIIAIISLLVGHTAWHWMGERADALRKTEWLNALLDGLPALLVAAVMLVGLSVWLTRRLKRSNAKSA